MFRVRGLARCPRLGVWVCACGLLLALAVRLWHLHALSRTPLFDGLIVDALGYARDGQVVLAHGVIEEGFYRPPLFPYIRASLALCGIAGPGPLRSLHALVGAINVALLCVFCMRLVSEEKPRLRFVAGSVTAVAAALYGPLVVHDVALMPQVWVNLLIAIAAIMATSRSQRVGIVDALAGMCLGLATTGWPPSILLALPLAWLRLSQLETGALFGTRQRRAAAVFIAAACLAPGLSAIHNATHGAAGIVVSGNSGINLWLGNNRHWRETSRARAGIRYDIEYNRATRAGATTLPGRELYYLSRVASEIAARPLAFVGRSAEKLYLFAHGREVAREQDFALLREVSPAAALLMWEHGLKFPFGLALPLALVCPAAALLRRGRDALLAGALIYACALSLFVLAARYRLAVVLLLLPLCAVSLASLVSQSPARAKGRWALLVCAALALNLPNEYTASLRATATERDLLLGQAHAARGDLRGAMIASARALERSPHDPDARLQLGQQLMRAGRPAEAARHFYRASELVPQSAAPTVLHAQAMIAMRRYRAAIADLNRALALNPYHGVALRDLARTLAITGQRKAAIDALQRYLAVDPRSEAAAALLDQLHGRQP